MIARDGIRMVNHRAVAAEAKVQLSLTTCYFKDIDTMIEEAFQQFMERMRPDLDGLWSGIFNYLDGFSARQLRQVKVREAVCERLATDAARHIIARYTRRPESLAVEQIFFTEARLSAPLRKLGMTHRQQLLVPMVRLCAFFNRVDPEVDYSVFKVYRQSVGCAAQAPMEGVPYVLALRPYSADAISPVSLP